MDTFTDKFIDRINMKTQTLLPGGPVGPGSPDGPTGPWEIKTLK